MEPKKRVVLADDETSIRAMLKALLSTINLDVVAQASNGNEAVEFYRKEKPDVLLLDINMPVKTGIEALRDIMREFPDAVVIMLTSVVDTAAITQCLELGASNYIRKDTAIANIKQIINETLAEA